MSQQGRAQWGHERETESDLLMRVRAGEADAFAEIVDRNQVPALRVAGRIVDPATAEDVVADCFEQLLVVLKRGDGPTYSVRPYFQQMVRNRAIDYRRRSVEVPAVLDETAVLTAELGDEEESQLVRNAFESLPERWQAALWLGVVESRSHAEIGRELDVAEGAATQLLHRAREGLRQSYLDAQVGGDCDRLRGLLGKYVRGRCSRRDARAVDAHLAGCPSCSAAVDRTRQLNTRLASALVVGLLGGAGLELLRRPGSAMAAELAGQPAHALHAASRSRGARLLLVGAAGAALTVGLVIAAPTLPRLQPDSILQFVPASTPTPSVGTPASPSPSPSATTVAPQPVPGQVRPSTKPSPSVRPTPSMSPVPSAPPSVPATTVAPPVVAPSPPAEPAPIDSSPTPPSTDPVAPGESSSPSTWPPDREQPVPAETISSPPPMP